MSAQKAVLFSVLVVVFILLNTWSTSPESLLVGVGRCSLLGVVLTLYRRAPVRCDVQPACTGERVDCR